MSPLWTEHTLWLGRDRAALAGHSRLPARGLPLAQLGVSETGPAAAASALLAATPRGRWRAGVELVLGSPWVRYQLLPWQEGVHTDAEWADYARALMRPQFGTATDGWRVRVADAPYGAVRLAAAVDESLCVSLAEAVVARGQKLASIEPALMQVYNRHRRTLRHTEFALLVLEDSLLTCAVASAGDWRGVVSLPLAGDLAATLRQAGGLLSIGMPEISYLAATRRPAQLPAQCQWLGPIAPAFATLEAAC
ncbi:hypothetical protein [Chitinimonas sp. BJYL2]|uniref:hypothetical protein n=1 Tax=Chitinimonas sp. BJYL2 TaxID=2976696 RepID=UPI0022B37397|nr:hypothetical protein [Chitinimonas sp. BJYL2]